VHVPKKNDVKFAVPGASFEGEIAQLEYERIVELEQQLSSMLAAHTERDRHIAQRIDELAPRSALLELAEASREACGTRAMETSGVQ
jgi:hypothetical protein